ncbi:NPC intracellular cholesterol transporter 2 homolog a-like [Diprion similis]|uniref:NPC intracellular cholesterol transporter 2 homolog a-like n=1 Tax=Diprion similis TaxID=362088 RepID=UPI001EF8131A|nr:NPC intracellular cholesterol transporter 2 homolog a-like [Diprion similis]
MIKEIFLLSIVLALAIESASATTVLKCGTTDPLPDSNAVQIKNCNEPPCTLKRGTKIWIKQTFKPTRNIASLTTKASGTLNGGVTKEFENVDGSNACDFISDPSGTPVGCPLTKDTEYVYKREFPIARKYPVSNVKVHWALVENGEDITCFEVPVHIRQ